MKTNETKAKFEAGKTYYGRHICDSDLIGRYRVERRTEKFVWVINVDRDGQPYKGESVLRRKVENWTNGETFMPNGRYSMALSICADDVWAPVSEIKETAANTVLAAETYRANVPPVLTVLPPGRYVGSSALHGHNVVFCLARANV